MSEYCVEFFVSKINVFVHFYRNNVKQNVQTLTVVDQQIELTNMKTIMSNLERKTFKDNIKLYANSNDATKKEIIVVFHSCMHVFKQLYGDITSYTRNRSCSFVRVFANSDLIYYIFQYSADYIDELNSLSLVDSIWMMHAFNSHAAKYITLNVGKLFGHTVAWTFQRFNKGVRKLRLRITSDNIDFLVDNLRQQNGIFSLTFSEADEPKFVLFKQSFHTFACRSKNIRIVMSDWRVHAAFEDFICQSLFYTEKSNCFENALVFSLTLRSSFEQNYPIYMRQNPLREFSDAKFYHISLPNVQKLSVNVRFRNTFCCPISFASTCQELNIQGYAIFDVSSCVASGIRRLLMSCSQIDCYISGYAKDEWKKLNMLKMCLDEESKSDQADNESDQNDDEDEEDEEEEEESSDSLFIRHAKQAIFNRQKLCEFGQTFTNVREIILHRITHDAIALIKGIMLSQKLRKHVCQVTFGSDNGTLSQMQAHYQVVELIEKYKICVKKFIFYITSLQDLETLQKLSSIYHFNFHLQDAQMEINFRQLFEDITDSLTNQSALDSIWGLQHLSTITFNSNAIICRHIKQIISQINLINDSRLKKNQTAEKNQHKEVVGKTQMSKKLMECKFILKSVLHFEQQENIDNTNNSTAVILTQRIERELKGIFEVIQVGLNKQYKYEVFIDFKFDYTVAQDCEKSQLFSLCHKICDELNKQSQKQDSKTKLFCTVQQDIEKMILFVIKTPAT